MPCLSRDDDGGGDDNDDFIPRARRSRAELRIRNITGTTGILRRELSLVVEPKSESMTGSPETRED